MSTEENKALMRRYYEAVSAGDQDRVAAFFAPELDRSHRVSYARVLAAFPDAQWTIEDLIAEGDKVVVRWSRRGTHQGEFQGVAPTGRQVTLTGIRIWRVAEGKLTETWNAADTLGLLQQLGAIPEPGRASG